MSKLPTLDEAKAEEAAAGKAYAIACQERERAQDAAMAAAKRLRLAKGAVNDAREREARNKLARDRRKAKTLAEQYGIDIDIDQVDRDCTHYWVTGPEDVYPHDEGDPWEGDHIGFDWSDVLDRVETYVADIKAKCDARAAQLAAEAG